MTISNRYTHWLLFPCFAALLLQVLLEWQLVSGSIFMAPTVPSSANRTAYLVTSNMTTSNSWLLIRGFTCMKEAKVFADMNSPELGIQSEDACVDACASLSDCRAVQWLDFSQLSETGNQKFCSLFTSLDDCYPIQGGYVQKNNKGIFEIQPGKYCAMVAGGRPAVNQPLDVAMEDLMKRNGSYPGSLECEQECQENIEPLDPSDPNSDQLACKGYNYLPQEVPSFIPGENRVMPCWYFFMDECEDEFESRIFLKASSLIVSNEARQAIKRYKMITDADVSIVSFYYVNRVAESTTRSTRVVTTRSSMPAETASRRSSPAVTEKTAAATANSQSTTLRQGQTATGSQSGSVSSSGSETSRSSFTPSTTLRANPTSSTMVTPTKAIEPGAMTRTSASSNSSSSSKGAAGAQQTSTAASVKASEATITQAAATTSTSRSVMDTTMYRPQTTVVYTNMQTDKVPEAQRGCSSSGPRSKLFWPIAGIALGKFLLFLHDYC